jgi:hypothetical protein
MKKMNSTSVDAAAFLPDPHAVVFCNIFVELIISLVMFIILLSGLGVAAFFVWPRIPAVAISEPYTKSGLDSLATTGSPVSVSFKLYANVTVDSVNYIDWDLNKVTFSGKIFDKQDVELKNVVVI